MWQIILGSILGAISAAMITIVVENLRKPKLQLSIADPDQKKYYEDQSAKFKRALRLLIENKSLPCWAKWMSRSPALQCGGDISFHHLDGQNVFGRSMIIRWPESPEPIPFEIRLGAQKGVIVDPARLVLEQRKDVHPGKYEFIDTACRFDNDEECYGWNNESYFSDPRWRNPKWKLPKGRYLVRVNVAFSGQSYSGLFRLINDVGIHDFRLDKALPCDYEKIDELKS